MRHAAVFSSALVSLSAGTGFIFEGQQRLLRSSYKESLQAFVKVQISLGNYHASNMRGKGDALPSGPL